MNSLTGVSNLVTMNNLQEATGPVVFSNAPQLEVTVSSSDIVSSMIHNVQQAAERVVQNGEEGQNNTR